MVDTYVVMSNSIMLSHAVMHMTTAVLKQNPNNWTRSQKNVPLPVVERQGGVNVPVDSEEKREILEVQYDND